jgi:hypothetical protein
MALELALKTCIGMGGMQRSYTSHRHRVLGSFSNSKDGDSTFLQNFGKFRPDYMASHPRI